MNAKTVTTLGQLRIGDSFVYMKGDRNSPWRVRARADKNKRVAVNRWDDRGSWKNTYDDLKKQDTKVMFLRHTVPVVHEECFIDDLQPGDIFQRPEDSIHKYVFVKRGMDFCDVRRMDEAACIKAGKFAKVIYQGKVNAN